METRAKKKSTVCDLDSISQMNEGLYIDNEGSCPQHWTRKVYYLNLIVFIPLCI